MKEKVKKAFSEKFHAQPDVVSRAPGRIEILGNHTDYNLGTVLSAAIDRYIHIAARAVPGTKCRCYDMVLKEEREFDLNALSEKRSGDWSNYIKGVLVELKKLGVSVPAFEMVIHGDVPLSAGMSSSAAFEMATVMAVTRLAKVNLDWLQMAKVGQGCENNYIGAHTGLLDQFSSLRGKKNSLVFSDFRTLETDTIPIPKGTAFVIVNSMVKHNLANEYNDRRNSCEDAVKCLARRTPEVRSLRDVPLKLLLKTRHRIRQTTFECAAHVVGEIARVTKGVYALEHKNLKLFGKLMFQSHESSRLLFQNSCPELDKIIAIAKRTPGVYGARLSGGGFGGITVHLVEEAVAEKYAQAVAAAYKSETGIEPQTFLCQAADGACIL